MKNNLPIKRRSIILLLGISMLWQVQGQALEVSGLDVSNEGIVSFQALIEAGHSPRERYELNVYTSADGFATPIDLVSPEMVPGQAYEFSFDGNQKVGAFDGPLTFRFEIEATQFPIEVNAGNGVFRRGKDLDISWKDYHEAGPYDVELYRNGSLVDVLGRNIAATSYSHALSKDLEKGSDYALLVTSQQNAEIDSEGIPVTIKSKTGLGIKLLPVVAVGGAVPLILLSGGSAGGEVPDLANPPEPPN